MVLLAAMIGAIIVNYYVTYELINRVKLDERQFCELVRTEHPNFVSPICHR